MKRKKIRQRLRRYFGDGYWERLPAETRQLYVIAGPHLVWRLARMGALRDLAPAPAYVTPATLEVLPAKPEAASVMSRLGRFIFGTIGHAWNSFRATLRRVASGVTRLGTPAAKTTCFDRNAAGSQ